MQIIISPFSAKLSSGKRNPKNYPYWGEVITKLIEKGYKVTQIGVKGEEKLTNDVKFNLPLQEIEKLINKCDVWISVDNFLQHLAHYIGKPGIVIWGYSDPNIFGYSENINILKSRDNLRTFQFQTWNEIDFQETIFPKPQIIINAIENFICED